MRIQMYYNRNMEAIKVLMIEDNKFVQEVVKKQLKSSSVWQFDITSTMYMEEALRLKNELKIDIVLSDLELPDSTMNSTMQILKNEFKNIPFVILTSNDDDRLLIQSLEVGARNYLCKEYLQQGSLISRTLYNALEYWKIESQLLYTATHDHLTGAVNKKHLLELVTNRIDNFIYDKQLFCLAICDLDNFRDINNNFGHMEGDRALQLFVQTIEETIRNKDTIARFGGDEFCILFPDTNRKRCEQYLKKLTSLKIELPGMTTIKGSYGGTVYEPGISVEELIIRADSALYQVKEEGKGFSRVL